MRTTVTLTEEASALIRKAMREQGVSFKDAVNAAVVAGLKQQHPPRPFSTPTFNMGPARLPLEHALRLAGELEDEELLRKRALGK